MKKYCFLMFMTCVSALVLAQSKVQVRMKKEVNGVTIVEERSFELKPGQDIEDALIENGIDKKGAKEISISIEQIQEGDSDIDLNMFPPMIGMGQIPFGQQHNFMEPKAYLGVTLKNEENAPVITDVQPQSPADLSHLKVGDRIIKIDDQKMENAQEVVTYIQQKKPGDQIHLKIKRNKETLKMTVPLETLPMSFPSFPFNGEFNPLTFSPLTMDSLFESPKAFLGVVPNNNFTEETGVQVDSVLFGSSAEKMGVQKGDIIIALNGHSISNFDTLKEIVGESAPGTPCEATIIRNGKTEILSGVFGARNMIIKDGYRIYQNDKGLDDQGNINLDFELDFQDGDLDNLLGKDFDLSFGSDNTELIIKNFSADQLKTMGIERSFGAYSFFTNPENRTLELSLEDDIPFVYRVIVEDQNQGIIYSDEKNKPVSSLSKKIGYDSWKKGEYTLKVYTNNQLTLAQRLIIQ
jgi:hypothetical protein